MGREKRQEAYAYLIDLASKQGYVTVDNILDCADDFDLPITDVDWLSSSITTRGIIVYDEEPSSEHTIDEDEDYDDYAQSDYEVIFNRVIELNDDLEPLISAIRTIKPPQRYEFSRLKYQVSEGNDHARNRMVEMHLRQAVKTALQRAELYDWPIEDTLNSAFCGLITAVDRYDPDSGTAFGSYANLWMLQCISRDMPVRNTFIYCPVHKKEQYYAVYPSLKEHGCIACDCMMKCKHIREIITDKCDSESNPQNIDDILFMIDQIDSIDEMMESYNAALSLNCDGEDEEVKIDYSLIDNWAEEKIIDKVERDNLISLKEYLKGFLKPKEYEVLRLRYGLDAQRRRTLDEVGNCFGITRERVRQIEKKAFERLQNPSKMRLLEKFYC